MSLPGSSPSRLGANFNPIHINILEQQNPAAAANNQQGNNNALQNQGYEFILAAVSSTIICPGFGWKSPPHGSICVSRLSLSARSHPPSLSTTTAWGSSPRRLWPRCRTW